MKFSDLRLLKPLLMALPIMTAGIAYAQVPPGLSLHFDANFSTSGIDGNNWNSLTGDASKDFDA